MIPKICHRACVAMRNRNPGTRVMMLNICHGHACNSQHNSMSMFSVAEHLLRGITYDTEDVYWILIVKPNISIGPCLGILNLHHWSFLVIQGHVS